MEGVSVLLMLPLCAMAAPPQPSGQAYAVNELIQTAVERNRELLAVRQRVVEARGLLRQAGVRPASSLQLGGATGSPLGSPGKEEYSAAYSQPIETGGKRDKRLQVAEKGVGLAEAELAERTLRLATEIKLRYLDAVTDEARLAALDRLIGTYRESLKLIEARVREGDAAPLDSQLLLVEVSRAEAQKRTVAGRIPGRSVGPSATVRLRRRGTPRARRCGPEGRKASHPRWRTSNGKPSNSGPTCAPPSWRKSGAPPKSA